MPLGGPLCNVAAMITELCECNWGVAGIAKLPPHYHYQAGRLPGGDEWLPGLISANGVDAEEHREFIYIQGGWDRGSVMEWLERNQP